MSGREVGPLPWQAEWRFVEEVLDHYPHAVDAGFRERLRSMGRILSIFWLEVAYASGRALDKHLEWVRNVFAPAPSEPMRGLRHCANRKPQ